MDQSTTLIRRSGEPFVTAVGSAINRLWLADEAAVLRELLPQHGIVGAAYYTMEVW